MDKIELQYRIIKGENLHTEFKESLPDNETIAKAIVCFANADGGQLIIGISNSGDIVGFGDLDFDAAISKIDDVAFHRCEPSVSILTETVDIDGAIILVVSIPKGEQRPYRMGSGLYYILNKDAQAKPTGLTN